jgi:RNA polymerase sigma factor (sigma-70 family)
MTNNYMSVDADHDAQLVAASISGNRDAFGQIVTRYQSLVCSLAYSATGSLGQSEDLAQETFITAWKQMGQLREPAKLRSWLCGIARNLINNWLRRQGHEPSHAAESLDAIPESPAAGPLPPDHTISNEEAAILWRSLEKIPEIYREPMVLFYREQQSVEQVAHDLELSEDAVKQRLSRGRKLLQDQVLNFVEGALQRTNPGKAFTLGVLAALPLFAVSATAATTGAAAVKGSTAAQASAAMGLTGMVLGPLAGLLGAWVGVNASLAGARSERERQFIKRQVKVMTIYAVAFCLVMFAMTSGMVRGGKEYGFSLSLGLVILCVAYVVGLFVLISRTNRRLRQIRLQDGVGDHSASNRQAAFDQSYEYRSTWSFLGLPLVHCCSGPAPDGRRRIAKGWIACGEIACGFMAFGGVAVGVVSMGGAAIGLIGLGGAVVAGAAFGGLGMGYWAVGGCAVGYVAFGGSALAWQAAMGGVAIAKEFALGGAAYALHANDELAAQVIRDATFFQRAQWLMKHAQGLIWLPMVLIIWPAIRILRMRKLQPGK